MTPQEEEEEISYYLGFCQCVDKYIECRKKDLLPDVGTEKVFGFTGSEDNSSSGFHLYGAFKTLYLHGRFSRTMIEKAFAYSETGYKDYIQLWMRSLPPGQRSAYTHTLCNRQFQDIVWWDEFCVNTHRKLMQQGDYDPAKNPPPIPLGDDRHMPTTVAIAKYASLFRELFNMGALFNGSPGDAHAPLVSLEDYNHYFVMDEEDGDLMTDIGKMFGIVKTDLSWGGQRSDSGEQISDSEIMLRTWNILYYSERLCKTEIEDAMVRGPSAAKDLFESGVKLALSFKCNPAYESLLQQAQQLIQTGNISFCDFPDKLVGEEELSECDYCGKGLPKSNRCSRCKVAMYCNRECQKEDFKRHKHLCPRYYAKQSLNMEAMD